MGIEYGVNTFLVEHGGMPNRHEPPSEPPMCKRGSRMRKRRSKELLQERVKILTNMNQLLVTSSQKKIETSLVDLQKHTCSWMYECCRERTTYDIGGNVFRK